MDGTALRRRLEAAPLVSDGGMGTSLVERGVALDACFEALNVEAPALVVEVHRGFVEAGAELLLSNTFGGNRFALGRRGLGERVAELNRASVRLAREAGARLVAGSVGPLRVRLAPVGRVRAAEARAAYAEQIAALAEAGVDAIVIETHADLAEVEQAVLAAREVAPGLAVLATLTFTRDDRTLLGSSPGQAAARLAALGVDALGVNCGQGPAQALRLIRDMRPEAAGIPLVARPNAGGPQQVGGRFLYPATPSYFGEHARALLDEGVALIGGCCGTGPEHVRAVGEALASPRSPAATIVADLDVDAGHAAEGRSRTELEARLSEGRFVVAVEVEPPRGYGSARMLAAAETLAEAGADVIDVADSPLARLRMSPWAACRLIEEQVKVETVLHFPTRGRNLLRLQGDLLAVHALGIRNLFVCLGDPVAIGDFPGGTDHVDVAPTGLIRLVTASFNAGRDEQGSSIGEPTSFVVGCAVNPAADDLEREVRLLRRKIDAGAAFALSQPVFEAATLARFRKAFEARFGELALPILAGVLPLAGERHATFLHNEVPGMRIPESVRERLATAGPRGETEGLRMAQDLALELRDLASGVYLMPQFGRFDLAAEIVEAVKSDGPQGPRGPGNRPPP